MPELPIRHSRLHSKLGSGAHKRTYDHPDNSDLVVKEQKRLLVPLQEDQHTSQESDKHISDTPNGHEKSQDNKEKALREMREKWHLLAGMEFYLTKIAYILYPEYITDIHMASTQDDIFQTIHEKVTRVSSEVSPIRSLNSVLRKLLNKFHSYIPHPRHSHIQQTLANSGIFIDSDNVANFGYSVDGNKKYIDSPYWSDKDLGVIAGITHTDTGKLKHAIDQIPDTAQRIRAEAYLQRFNIFLNMYTEHHNTHN